MTEHLPGYESFNAFIEIKKDELSKIQKFIKDATDSPILFFTDTKNVLQSPNNLFTQALGSYEKLNNTAFHQYIADYLTIVLNDWCKENHINDSFKIDIYNKQTFPSPFAIYLNTTVLMTFNIYEKWYDIPQTLDKSLLNIDNQYEIDILEQLMERKLKDSDRYEKMLHEDWRLLLKEYGLFEFLFKHKFIKNRAALELDFLVAVQENIQEKIDGLKYPDKIYLEHLTTSIQKSDQLCSFFESIHYQSKFEQIFSDIQSFIYFT